MTVAAPGGRSRAAVATAFALAALLAGCGESAGSGAGAGAQPARADSGAASESATLAIARRHDPSTYRAALRDGGRVVPFRDGRSFAVVAGARTSPRTAIVTLHGYKSTAFDQFEAWHPYAARHGWGLIALQWRRGFTRRAFSYSPAAIYAEAARLLAAQGVGRRHALLHGYSSGGIRTYGMTALDARGHRFFGLSIANAGAALKDFPLRSTIVGGRLGRRPLAGSHWVLYCGGRDPHPTYTGCPVMRASARFVTRYGGQVVRLLVDPRAGHGGFLEHPANVETALGDFERVLRGG